MLLSIIIPIYNAEYFINRCLTSIYNQLTKECEIILINDGSTDNSLLIIEEFIRINHNKDDLKLINISNNGPGFARNTGVQLASGKYIAFIDADDIVFHNYIAKILAALYSNPDIIQFNYKLFTDNIFNTKIPVAKLHNLVGEYDLNDVRNYIFGKGKWFPWARVFKKEILVLYPFPVSVFYEDTLCLPFIFLESYRIVFLDDFLYGYRINPLGTTSNHKIEHVNTLYNFFDYLMSIDDSIPINILKIQTARGLSYFSAEFNDNKFYENKIIFKLKSVKFNFNIWRYLLKSDRLFILSPHIYHIFDRIRLCNNLNKVK